MLPAVAARANWASEAAVPRIVAIAMTTFAAVTLWMPWITAGAVEERSSRTAFWAMPVGAALAALTLGTAVLMVASTTRFQSPRWPTYVLGGCAIAPGGLLIGAVEFAQSLIPTSLTPILTNSDLLTLRAEYGAWAHVGFMIGGLTLWSLSNSMSRGHELVNPTRASGRILLLVAVIAIPIIRALPLFSVVVTSDVASEEERTLASVEIVPGEVPLLGVLSTVAVLGFIGFSLLAVIRPHHLALVGASVCLGSHLAVIWLQVVIASIASGVLPDDWVRLIGDWAAIEISTLHTSTLTVVTTAVGFVAVLMLARGQSELAASSSWVDNQSRTDQNNPPVSLVRSDDELP